MTGFYFDRQRNLANGIAHTGGGVGVFILAPMVHKLIDIYNWRGSLIIVSGICLNNLVVASAMRPIPAGVLYEKTVISSDEKTDETHNGHNRQRYSCIDLEAFASLRLQCVGISMLCVAMTSSTVFIHLADYAKIQGSSHHEVATVFAAIGISNACGKLLFGMACNSDDIDNFLVYGGTVSILALVAFALPLFISTYIGQVAFGVLFGLYFAGSNIMVSAIPPMIVPLQHLATSMGILLTYLGIGFLIGPVIAGKCK